MAYGADILTNGSAETQDTTGWTLVGDVIVEENTTEETRYIPIVDDRDVWMEEQQTLTLVGPAGDYSFVFASDSDASISQILYASDVGAQPVSFELVCKWKLMLPQDLWDNKVMAMARLKISYTDNSFDYFIIPLVKGVSHSDRTLINNWLIVYSICTVFSGKTISYVEVSAATTSCTKGLHIDYIELRKET